MKNTTDLDKIELFSDDVQDLMARPPASIIRYGAAALLGTIIIVIALSFLIKYPDTVTAKASITSSNPPAFLRAAAGGSVHQLLVNDGAEVKNGQVLAVLTNDDIYKNVKQLKAYITSADDVLISAAPDVKKLPGQINLRNLGILQLPFLNFRKTILQAKYQGGNEAYKLATLDEALARIKADVTQWEKRNLLISPINGKVSFTKPIQQNAPINTGDVVFVVTPNSQQAFTANLTLSKAAGAQVQTGQQVKINLDNYPANEHGQLVGKVVTIDRLSQHNAVQALVRLPAQFKTDKGEQLTYTPDMQGTAEVFLQNKSVGERIFSSVSLVNNKILK